MTTNEAYERFLIENEANGITDNIQSSKGRFVVNYNKFLTKMVEWFIERKDSDESRYIEILKLIDKPLSQKVVKGNKNYFKLPENYFDFIDLNAYASTSKCQDQLFKTTEVKPENINKYLTDVFSKPSFKYRETLYTIGESNIILYTDDFEFTKTLLSYYRKPQYIELVDPENPESQLKDIELEFDDKFLNRVITLTSAGHSLNTNDPKFQVLKQEAISKI